jgi:hypothetical protein
MATKVFCREEKPPYDTMELSTDQRRCLEACLVHPHSVVTACCGGGKTRLLLAAAMSVTPQKSLILSFNCALAAETRDKADDLSFQISVHNIHQLATEIFKRSVPDNRTLSMLMATSTDIKVGRDHGNYALICVDEIQDVYGVQIEFIQWLIQQQQPDCRVVLVGDAAQTVYDFLYDGGVDDSLYGQYHRLCEGPWYKDRLLETYRLSPETCAFVNRFFRAHDDPPLVSGKPSDIAHRPTVHIGDNYGILELIDSVLSENDAGQVMVLCNSLRGAASSVIEAHLVSKNVPMREITASGDSAENRDRLILTTFNRAKGLERDVVIVVGLTGNHWKMNQPKCNDGQSFDVCPAAHVAVTRAITKLHLYVHCYQGLYPTMHSLDTVDAFAEVIVNPKCLLAPTIKIHDVHEPYVTQPTAATFARWAPDRLVQQVNDTLVEATALDDWMVMVRDVNVRDLMDALSEEVVCTAMTLWMTRFDGEIMDELKRHINAGRRVIRKTHQSCGGPWKRRLDTVLRLDDAQKTHENALVFAVAYDSMHVLKQGGISDAMRRWTNMPSTLKQPKLAAFTDMCNTIERDMKRPILCNGSTLEGGVRIPLLCQGRPVVFAVKDAQKLTERALRRIWWYLKAYGGTEAVVYYVDQPGTRDVFQTTSLGTLQSCAALL